MNWFKNARTATKLMLAFGLMAALVAFVGYKGVTSTALMSAYDSNLYEHHTLGILSIKQAEVLVTAVARDMRQVFLEPNADAVRQKEQVLVAEMQKLDEQLAATEKTLVTDDGKATLARVRESLPQYLGVVRQVIAEVSSGDSKAGLAAMNNATSLRDQITSDIAKLSESKIKLAKDSYDEVNRIEIDIKRELLIIISVAILLALGLGYIIARQISNPLTRSVTVLEAVAAGDLTPTLDIDSKDEIGRLAKALNTAVQSMRQTMTGVRTCSEHVSAAAEQLAAAAEELSSGAQEQASGQEETSSTLQEITATVKQNADSAGQANQLAGGARGAAETGRSVVDAAVAAMGEINNASKRIADIITAIDEIAFQTNLLALNAAVEAARAGEQGRGFAVVAAEVRSLAQRSATAAKEIKALIQDSVRKVENGSELVNRSGETLGEIVTSVKSVTDIVGEIAAASREQAHGIDQVTKAMLQMDQVTQQNSAQTEELTATAQTLAAQSQELRAMVQQFVLEAGAAAQSVPSAPVMRTAHTPGLANLKKRVGSSVAPERERKVKAGFEEF